MSNKLTKETMQSMRQIDKYFEADKIANQYVGTLFDCVKDMQRRDQVLLFMRLIEIGGHLYFILQEMLMAEMVRLNIFMLPRLLKQRMIENVEHNSIVGGRPEIESRLSVLRASLDRDQAKFGKELKDAPKVPIKLSTRLVYNDHVAIIRDLIDRTTKKLNLEVLIADSVEAAGDGSETQQGNKPTAFSKGDESKNDYEL